VLTSNQNRKPQQLVGTSALKRKKKEKKIVVGIATSGQRKEMQAFYLEKLEFGPPTVTLQRKAVEFPVWLCLFWPVCPATEHGAAASLLFPAPPLLPPLVSLHIRPHMLNGVIFLLKRIKLTNIIIEKNPWQ
jgi:hypothetical protein